MNEHIYIADASDNLINDPDRSIEYASDIDWASTWPKGYGSASFQVKRDIARQWAVKQAYDLKIRHGHTIVYQGRIDDLNRALSASGGQTITVTATGWYAVLTERRLRKRWRDNAPVSRMVWPSNRYLTGSQQGMDANKRDDIIIVRAGYGDVTKSANDAYHENYTVPIGSFIKGVDSLFAMRSGEGITIRWWNDDTATAEEEEVSLGGGGQSDGTFNATMASGLTDSLTLRFILDATDIYDENDRAQVYDMVIYCYYDPTHPQYTSETYTTGQLIKDVLILCGKTNLSTDYSSITDPALTLAAFISQGDNFETGDSLIQRLCAYGDSSQNTYGLAVWDSTGTSDGKPRVDLRARSVSSWEWVVTLADLETFRDSPSLDELYNWVIVKYVDDREQELYLTPDTEATLKDTTSITAYGERHSPVIEIGKATSAKALDMGKRYLAYHKDPLRKSELAIKDQIRDTRGVWWPANRVRGGDRVRLLDYEGGVTYFLRGTSYNQKTGICRMTPDLPEDDIAMLLTYEGLKRG